MRQTPAPGQPDRRRLRRLAVSWFAVVALTVGCSPEGPHPADGTGSPEGLKADLQALRDQNGLFIYPGYYAQRGSVYSTALLADATGRWMATREQRRAAAATLCQGPDAKAVHPVWLAWAASVLFTQDELGSTLPRCLPRTPPEATGDPNEDIPLLWAWAETGANWKESREGIISVVTQRLASADVDRVTSPYVLWRLDELHALAGAPDEAVSHPAPPPAALATPADLLDLWGYVQRCHAHRELCATREAPRTDTAVNAERTFGDDLSMAAAIAVARAEGDNSAVRRFKSSANARRDSQTGLVRSARPEGDVETTFLALRIAPDLFPGPAASSTAQVMRDDLRLSSHVDMATRMKVLAILRAVGGQDWVKHRPEIQDALANLRRTPVTESTLQSTVELVDALRLLDPGVPQLTLQTFPVRDPRSEQLARLALANADMFRDPGRVRDSFKYVAAELLAEARNPKEPLVAYYTSVNAIAGAGVEPDASEHRGIVAALRTLQGCRLDGRAHPFLFRASAASTESCSFAATWQAVRSGFAYEASR